MPDHICETCERVFKQKGHLATHKNRKNPCKKDGTIEKIVEKKVEEVLAKTKSKEDRYTIVETFVGAGGAHIGFKQAGFETMFVNDIDGDTIHTLLQNNMIQEGQYFVCPIEELTSEKIKEKYKTSPDVLFGGIVCKGFSLAGVRNPFDPRNYLYKHQLRLVEILNPRISVIENVTAIKNMFLYKECNETLGAFQEYTKISDENKNLNGEKSSKRKNNQDYAILNTIVNANKAKMSSILEKIEPYKYSIMDDIKSRYETLGYTFYEKILQTDKYGGYTNRKRIIMVAVRNDISKKYEFPDELPNSYTLQDALNKIDYNGVNSPNVDDDNKPMRHSDKTIRRFKLIPEGSNISDVIEDLPDELKISAFYSRGNTQRLDRSKPAPTLVPGHSNFPIHPWEDRSITVREAATITGFPGTYKFHGSHTSRCIQIGNAVPVQLAYQVALSIKNFLKTS